MRIIITGSRDWHDTQAIREALSKFPRGSVVIHGGASGADNCAGMVARTMGFTVERYPANWSKWGRAAGVIRNQEMLDKGADIILAFWLNGSTGTYDMIQRGLKAGIPVEMDCRWEENA